MIPLTYPICNHERLSVYFTKNLPHCLKSAWRRKILLSLLFFKKNVTENIPEDVTASKLFPHHWALWRESSCHKVKFPLKWAAIRESLFSFFWASCWTNWRVWVDLRCHEDMWHPMYMSLWIPMNRYWRTLYLNLLNKSNLNDSTQ